MEKWEYELIESSFTEVKGRLNEMGKQGWEAVSMVIETSGTIVVLLKRKTGTFR